MHENARIVEASLFGLAKRSALYRPGIGSTLINDTTAELLEQNKYEPQAALPKDDVNAAWPAGNKLSDEFPAEISKTKLDAALENLLTAKLKKASNKPAKTKAALVIYDGKLIAEKYAEGYNDQSLFLGWSVTKTITAALAGILGKNNKLTVDEKAPIPQWKGTNKEAITIKNILQQTTGLNFIEKYSRPGHVTKMLFSIGDMAGYVSALKLKHRPGSFFSYSSGNTNLLSKIIRDKIAKTDYYSFPYQQLFHKIGAYSFQLEADSTDMYIGSSYAYATIKDYARFGLLYYNRGKYNGEQILPENWVAESIQPSEALNNDQYGYQLWLNGKNKSGVKSYPAAPDDLYCAHGYGSQAIYIIPSKKLIILRFGQHEYDENAFLGEVMNSFY